VGNFANASKIVLRKIFHCFTNRKIQNVIYPKRVQITLIIYNLATVLKLQL